MTDENKKKLIDEGVALMSMYSGTTYRDNSGMSFIAKLMIFKRSYDTQGATTEIADADTLEEFGYPNKTGKMFKDAISNIFLVLTNDTDGFYGTNIHKFIG